MKTRIQYANNEMGRRLAKAEVKKNGGRAVSVEDGRNYWYSFHYTPTEIFSDFIGKNVTIH